MSTLRSINRKRQSATRRWGRFRKTTSKQKPKLTIETLDSRVLLSADTNLLSISGIGLMDAPTGVVAVSGPFDEGLSLNMQASFTDPDSGSIVSYEWDFDGDGQYDDASGASVILPWSVMEALGCKGDGSADVSFGLQVTDDDNEQTTWAYGENNITMYNVAPTADAGGDQMIDEGQGVFLTAAGSTDPNANDTLTYAWDLDNDGEYDDADTISTVISWSMLEALGVDGNGTPEITVGLQVADDDGGVDYDSINISINNVAPTADAGGPYVVQEGDDLVLTGGFTDPNFNDYATSYAWDIDGDGTTDKTGQTVTLNQAEQGAYGITHDTTPYQISLTVTDDNGGVSAADLSAVIVVNQDPTDIIINENDVEGVYQIDEGQDLNLDPNADDFPGDSVTFYWDLDNDGFYDDFITGQFGTAPWALLESLGLPSDGTSLNISVLAADGDGGWGTADGILIINNLDPTADADGPYTINEGDDLVLDGSGSSDPGNDPLTYNWEIDGNAFSTTDAVTTVPWSQLQAWGVTDGAGHDVDLLVDDGDGGSDEGDSTLTIINIAPTAEANGPYLINEGDDLIVDATGSFDPGDTLEFEWNIDGNTFTTSNLVDTIPWATIEGWGLASDNTVLDVSLTATEQVDGDGESDSDTTKLLIANLDPTTVDVNIEDPGLVDDEYYVVEGNDLFLMASAEDPGDDSLTFLWDLDNDGVYDDASGQGNEYGQSSFNVPWSVLEHLESIYVNGDDRMNSDGSYFDIHVQVIDDEGGVAYGSAVLAIANVAPSPDPGGEDVGDNIRLYTMNEGEDLTLDASATTDPDANDVITYSWDLNDDGTFDIVTQDAVVVVPWSLLESFNAPPLDSNGGWNPILLQVDDGELGEVEPPIADAYLQINNVAPTADAGGPYILYEGDGVDLVGAGTDPNANDEPLTYEWTLTDGESSYTFAPPSTDSTLSLDWTDIYGLWDDGTPIIVSLEVTDQDGASTVDQGLLMVIQNIAPDVETYVPDINEGQDLTLYAMAFDPGEVGPELYFAWDLDGDGVFDDAGGPGVMAIPDISIQDDGDDFSGVTTSEIVVPWATLEHIESFNNHIHSDGQPIDISLLVLDGEEHGIALATTTMTINNVAPTAEAGGDELYELPLQDGQEVPDYVGMYVMNEGEDLVLDASQTTDPDANDVLFYQWDLNGDGIYEYDAGTEPIVTVPWSYLESLGYKGDGNPEPIGLRVHDEEGLGQMTLDIYPNDEYTAADIVSMFSLAGFTMDFEGDGSGLVDLSGLSLPMLMTTFNEDGIATIPFDGDNNDLIITADTPDGINGTDVVFIYDEANIEELFVEYTPGYQDIDPAMLKINNVDPTADAGGPYVVNEDFTGSIVLDGSGSTDPNANDVLTYHWTLYDADHSYSFNAGTSPTFSINLDDVPDLWDDGTSIAVQLTVLDGDGGSDVDQDLLMVIQNVAPTVDAKLDDPDNEYVIDEGDDLVLNAGATDPGESFDELTFLWDLDGDGVFNDAEGASVTVAWADIADLNVPTDGTPFEINLMVYDGEEHGVAFDTATLTINNTPPTPDAGDDITINEGDMAFLFGTYTDPYGEKDAPFTFHWDFDDAGATSDSQLATHTFFEDGVYNVVLTVTDKDGGSGTDTVIVTVLNVAPTVDAGEDKISTEGDQVAFSGQFTDPGIYDTHTVVWDFGDGSSTTEAPSGPDTLNVRHTFADNGIYTVRLTVTDDDGGVGYDELKVYVNNAAPVIYAGQDVGIDEGDTVIFSGEFTDKGQTSDDIYQYQWMFGDGTVTSVMDTTYGNNIPASHTYIDDGVYTSRLIVWDKDGEMSFDEVTVIVSNVPPMVTANVPDKDRIEKDTYYQFDGTIVDPGILDTHTILWDFGDGYVDSSNTLTPSHKYTESGVYTVSLIVHDDDYDYGIDLMEMTVYEQLDVVNNFVAHYGANGLMTVKLYGPGTLDSVTYVAGIGLDFETIATNDTTDNSKLVINARGGHRSIGDLATVGDIMINDGSLGRLSAYRMNLRGSLEAPAGSLGNVQFGALDWESSIMTGAGDIGMLSVKYDIEGSVSSAGSIGKVMSTRGGLTDTGALLANNGSINAVRLASDIDGMLMASDSINSVTSRLGELSGTIRAGDDIGKVSFANIDSATISAGGNIKLVSSKLDIVDSYLFASYDIGADGLLGTADDIFNSSGASIGGIKANLRTGAFDGTYAMAGVKPYDAASGVMLASDSSLQTVASFGEIGKATVGQVFFNGDPTSGIYGLFAATDIGNIKYIEVSGSGAPDFEAQSSW